MSMTVCVCVCVTCRWQKGPAGLKLYPGARSFINGRILMTSVCACTRVRVYACAGERLRLCVRVGGKISMCSLPLHTAEQIGEVVRSHNTRGQPGDDDGCRRDGAKLMAECEESLRHDGMWKKFTLRVKCSSRCMCTVYMCVCLR